MPGRPGRPSAAPRITIGYMSPDLREHPVAHMLLDVLPRHDRSRFKVLTIGTLPEDKGIFGREIAKYTEGHIDLTPLDDSAACHELRRQGVDILVDLAGSTKWCRPGVLARRPCPVQVLWLGCPCSTGNPYYDAFIVDEVVAPPGYENYCTEPLYRLKCCYHPISTGLGSISPRMTKAAVGLPEGKTIVGVLQQPAKIHPPFIDHVASIVGRHPEAHAWVRVHPDGVAAAQAHLHARGLPPDRLHIAQLYKERGEYLAIHTLVDLIVDSFPYGGHSTTGEAIIQGTPVLTILGRSIHSRVAASMLHEMGLDELVFPDVPAMQAGLDRLLGDPAALATQRQRCQQAAHAYRDHGPIRLTRALEECFANLLDQAPKSTGAG
jgi:protein O-GlcNAc transferase